MYKEMKKNVGMTIAQEAMKGIGMKDGNGINLCPVYPANNPYIIICTLGNSAYV